MDGKVYNLLKKIDDIGIAKFGLEKDHRIYLKRLLLDEEFLNKNIDSNGGLEYFLDTLNSIYNELYSVSNDLGKIKKISDNPDFQNIVNDYFGKELEDLEAKRNSVINDFVKKEIDDESFIKNTKDIQKSDQDKMNEILNNLKSNK